ncbi:MAG: hypothetical protein K2X38_14730 [Gemmataceae bacterium]|nr:hypothetical protein [Gemmataceae bacterium]
MPGHACPRCRRFNPEPAYFCWFDGIELRPHAGDAQKLAIEFTFPTGRRARTFEELAQACQDDWNSARDLLQQGAFRQFFVSLGRNDLAQRAEEAARETNADVALARFLQALPAAKHAPKLDLQPRRIFLGTLAPGETRSLQATLKNLGAGMLQGAMTVTDGDGWIRLADAADPKRCLVNTSSDQRVGIAIDTRGLPSAQSYAAKLMVVTNGGVVELPVGFDLAAQAYPKAPFQGASTARELAEKMRKQPKAAGPALESGDIQRWFASNGWKYPVEGTPARGVAGVQQFFEAMGLSRPPLIQVTPRTLEVGCRWPETKRVSFALQTTSRKWVYATIASDSTWLRPVQRNVAGPQQAAVAVEVDSRLAVSNGAEPRGVIHVTANGGQKIAVPVQLVIDGAPRPRKPLGSVTRTLVCMMLFLMLLRMVLIPFVDMGGRSEIVRQAAVKTGLNLGATSFLHEIAGWLRLPWGSILAGSERPLPEDIAGEGRVVPAREFRDYFAARFIRGLALWTFWIGGPVGAYLAWRRGGGSSDAWWGFVAGLPAGAMAAATVASLFLVCETVPHMMWSAVFRSWTGIAAWTAWAFIAVLGWGLCGLAIGLGILLIPGMRGAVLPPVAAMLGGLFGFFRLRGLAAMCRGELASN